METHWAGARSVEAEVEVVRLEGPGGARQGQLTGPVDRTVDTWHSRLGIHHRPNKGPGPRNTVHIARHSLLGFRHPVHLELLLYLEGTE